MPLKVIFVVVIMDIVEVTSVEKMDFVGYKLKGLLKCGLLSGRIKKGIDAGPLD